MAYSAGMDKKITFYRRATARREVRNSPKYEWWGVQRAEA